MRRTPVAAIFLWTVACVTGGSDGQSQEDLAAIRTVLEGEITAANAGDAEAFNAILTDDVVVMAPNQAVVAGQAAHQWVRDLMTAVSIQLDSYEDDELVVDGDLAYHRYTFRWIVTPAGADPFVERGKGVHILRRQPDGSWRMSHDIWNLDTPAPNM